MLNKILFQKHIMLASLYGTNISNNHFCATHFKNKIYIYIIPHQPHQKKKKQQKTQPTKYEIFPVNR